MTRQRGLYRWRNLLDKAPNIISTAIFATVNFVAGIVFVSAHIDPSPAFAGVILSGQTALVLLLNLFVVQPNTVTNASAAAQVDQATAQTKADIAALAPSPKASRRSGG